MLSMNIIPAEQSEFEFWYGDLEIPQSEAELAEYLLNMPIPEWCQKIKTTSTPEKKWFLASGLQKAVRRGDSRFAVRCASALLHVDYEYLWRRLPVIAFEDVGLGNPLACALTLLLCKSKKWRQQNNERMMAFAVIDMLASGMKDRTCTDLMQIAGYWKLGDNFETGEIPADDLEGIVFETQIFWHLLGTKRDKNDCVPASDGSMQLWEKALVDSDVPFLIEYLALRGRIGLSHPFYHTIVPLWRHMKAHEASLDSVDNPPDPFGDEVIEGFPASTFDVHNAHGKRALAYWTKAYDRLTELKASVKAPDWIKLLGSALFRVESGYVNRQIEYPLRLPIYDKSVFYSHVCKGLPEDRIVEMKLILQNGREKLNYARKRILGAVPSQQ